MSTQYSLTVTNNSTQYQDLCVYQNPVDLAVPDAMSLAWLTAPAWPQTTVNFNWTLDYSFVWSQTGSLQPGEIFLAQQIQGADPNDLTANHVLFDCRNGAFTLTPGGVAKLGSLYVTVSSGVPIDTAAVGIGMSNAGVFAVQAQPNTNLVFTPHPEYWITAGTYEQGQVLDLEQITNSANVEFEATTDMVAVLSPVNTWQIKPGQA